MKRDGLMDEILLFFEEKKTTFRGFFKKKKLGEKNCFSRRNKAIFIHCLLNSVNKFISPIFHDNWYCAYKNIIVCASLH